MNTYDPKVPTREQLEEFLPNNNMIRLVERLFMVSGTLTPESIAEINAVIESNALSAGITEGKANRALSELKGIRQALALIATKPKPTNKIEDVIIPIRTTRRPAEITGATGTITTGTEVATVTNGIVTSIV